MDENMFPVGSFWLRGHKDFTRSHKMPWFIRSWLKLSDEFKANAINQISIAYPKRKFVFVGDSGERDPEIYGKMTRLMGIDKILCIYIRKVNGSVLTDHRFQLAFKDLPNSKWFLFDDVKEIEHITLQKMESGQCF